MTDWFAFLDLPPRPQLAEADIKERYLRLAAKYHPDGAGGDEQAFADLQVAYKGLLEPAGRVRHLLAVKFPDFQTAGGAMPLTELFMEVGPVLQQAKVTSEQLEKATATLSRTMASLAVAETLQKLRSVREAAEQARQSLEARLAELDRRWPEVAPGDLARWASEWNFLAKWRAELNEWEFRLANALPISKVGQT